MSGLYIVLDLRDGFLDAHQIASAIKAGVTTPQLIADVTGLDIVEDAIIVDPTWYASLYASDVGELATSADCAEDAAKEFVVAGDWGNDGACVGVSTWQRAIDADGNRVCVNEDTHLIDVEPDHESMIMAACGGEHSAKWERCCGGEPTDHEWTSEGEGGCAENPGVWSTGGTAMRFATHCELCGLHRIEHVPGSQRNPGEHDTVRYEMPTTWCAKCESEECSCEAE